MKSINFAANDILNFHRYDLSKSIIVHFGNHVMNFDRTKSSLYPKIVYYF